MSMSVICFSFFFCQNRLIFSFMYLTGKQKYSLEKRKSSINSIISFIQTPYNLNLTLLSLYIFVYTCLFDYITSIFVANLYSIQLFGILSGRIIFILIGWVISLRPIMYYNEIGRGQYSMFEPHLWTNT